jgi:hypothetical protein
MNNSELTQLNIEISASDAAIEEIDRMTRQLLTELRELDIESAEVVKGGISPEGSKGDPVMVGSIVLSTLPTVLPAVIELVKSWTMRGQGRTIKFKGKGIEYEGSPAELQKLLASLEKGKKNRLAGDSTTDAPPPKKK